MTKTYCNPNSHCIGTAVDKKGFFFQEESVVSEKKEN